MPRVMAVSFERYGRLYYLDPGEQTYAVGDRVLVPTESGPEVAECVWAPEWVDDDGRPASSTCRSAPARPPTPTSRRDAEQPSSAGRGQAGRRSG